MFTPLSKDQIYDIVKLQMNSVKKMIATNGISLDITPAAIQYLADKGYDPTFGARPVKRVIHREILNRLSKDILAQNVDKDKPILIDFNGEKLIFKN